MKGDGGICFFSVRHTFNCHPLCLFDNPSLQINFNRVLGITGYNDIAHAAVVVVAAGNGERRTTINHIIAGGELEGVVSKMVVRVHSLVKYANNLNAFFNHLVINYVLSYVVPAVALSYIVTGQAFFWFGG